MSYEKHFKLTDDIILYLNNFIKSVTDDFISSRYIGLVATAAVTSYECAIKNIFINFANKKHKILGTFTQSYFGILNGKIKFNSLKKNISKFGHIYVKKFENKISNSERIFLRNRKISIINCYNNIIEWRHKFIHEGEIPATVTYKEAVVSYEAGKELLICLYEAMKR